MFANVQAYFSLNLSKYSHCICNVYEEAIKEKEKYGFCAHNIPYIAISRTSKIDFNGDCCCHVPGSFRLYAVPFDGIRFHCVLVSNDAAQTLRFHVRPTIVDSYLAIVSMVSYLDFYLPILWKSDNPYILISSIK